ncbi:MAG: hypothetical protein CMB32_05485 [Euryarchaeota archaeon]|nr:hypothetical protein [Euryarchaeota archaeon]|tara:strand:+ start:2582 stop:3139 length:558 start_codon:yes stop_codon:yes gene_type:complete
MKPTNDQFEQHVKGLYDGYEVPAPASTKDAVFNKLDAANYSGSFASKSLLIAASIFTVGAIYMISDETTQTPVEAVESIEVMEAPVVEEAVEIQIATEDVVEEVEETPVIEDPVIEAPVEVVEAPVEVETPVEVIEVVETPKVEEIKEVAPPVEIVEIETVVEEKKEEEKKEVEWVLPASIKVEK